MKQIIKRRTDTEAKLSSFAQYLKEAGETLQGKACVYATGSYGRLEASQHSDLDVFIIGLDKASQNEKNKSQLNNLGEILIKADLIGLTRTFQIRDFDGDGKYLTHYPIGLIADKMGTPEDDVLNTFSARLLLLLESRPILEPSVYDTCIDRVLSKYWRDYPDHKDDFMPAFLTNDILRLWRTLCVNYEARTKTEPNAEKIKRKVKNYKLKYSRLLTCFSTILYLIGQYQIKNTVSPVEAHTMVRLTPTQRLEWLISEEKFLAARECLQRIIFLYDEFLEVTDIPEEHLRDQFSNKKESEKRFNEAFEFGDKIAKAIDLVGEDGRFRRMLIV